jgi:hypothetical protein
MDAAEFAVWRGDIERVEHQLADIERAERVILESLNCPSDPVGIWDVLTGRTPAPWPRRTSKANQQRARHAMFALIYVGRVRSHLYGDNPRVAIFDALQLGAMAGDVVTIAQQVKAGAPVLRGRKKGGAKRGQQVSVAAKQHDAVILRRYRRWHNSDELQDQHRSASVYIAREEKLPLRTVQRALKRHGKGRE